MSDDDRWTKFQQWRSGGAAPGGGPQSGGGNIVSDVIGSTGATLKGVEKGLAQLGAPPGGISLNEADPKGPVATWAKSEDKQYPIAEKAGRYAAEYGPLALLPDVGAPEAFARAVPEIPRLARVAGKGAEGLWKGAVGGQTQGNPQAGAVFGGGSAAIAETLKRFPTVLWPAGFLALGAMSQGRELPWGAWHMAHPLAALAAAALGLAPGVSGAVGADVVGPNRRPNGNQGN